MKCERLGEVWDAKYQDGAAVNKSERCVLVTKVSRFLLVYVLLPLHALYLCLVRLRQAPMLAALTVL